MNKTCLVNCNVIRHDYLVRANKRVDKCCKLCYGISAPHKNNDFSVKDNKEKGGNVTVADVGTNRRNYAVLSAAVLHFTYKSGPRYLRDKQISI